MSVQYTEDTDADVAGTFLVVDDGSQLFEYHMEFTEGAESDIDDDDHLEDLEDEVLTILGAPFTVTSATVDTTADDITIEMLGGQVAEVLRDGETKTFTIDGNDYEVTALFISDSGTAKLQVNGLTTGELEDGDTEILGGDVTVGIQSVLTNQREGIVEFYLGANKLEITDTDYTDSTYAGGGSVEVREESVDEEDVIVRVTEIDADTVEISYIKYNVDANDDYFVPAGSGLKEHAEDENEGAFLTDTWDVVFTGLMATGETELGFAPVSDHSYEFFFENLDGGMYDFPLVTNEAGTFKFGNEDDLFWFEEAVTFSSGLGANGTNTTIADNDYFIVSDRATSATEDKALVNVLRYQSISTGDSTVTFQDLAGGDVVVSYTGTPGGGATGELIVAGASHDFYIGSDEELMMDLNADGAITAGQQVFAVTRGGGIVDFGDQTVAGAYADTNVTLYTPASQFDEDAHGAEASNVSLTAATGNEVDLSVTLAGAGEFVDDPEDDDFQRGYTDYGAFFELNSPSGDEADELTVMYPLAQRGAQVFVTAGTVEVSEAGVGTSGAVTTTTLNPIAVGLAVLDTDAPAVGSTRMIVVGGPCVNTVAAQLMGNPENCAEGFMPGKAVIKLFEQQNALLVAGYGAQDTLGAAYVLADAADYDLEGSEVEVVVADLNTITVNPVG
jgi:hypothetical protein